MTQARQSFYRLRRTVGGVTGGSRRKIRKIRKRQQVGYQQVAHRQPTSSSAGKALFGAVRIPALTALASLYPACRPPVTNATQMVHPQWFTARRVVAWQRRVACFLASINSAVLRPLGRRGPHRQGLVQAEPNARNRLAAAGHRCLCVRLLPRPPRLMAAGRRPHASDHRLRPSQLIAQLPQVAPRPCPRCVCPR